MGTRNLTVVYDKKGDLKIAQYGQWDGYPGGQGSTCLNFLKDSDLSVFQNKLERCHFMNDEKNAEVDNFLQSIGSKEGWMDMEQANKFKKKYPHLSRDMGAEILEYVYDNEEDEVYITNSIDFVTDSLFNEWTYVIDFQKNVFEVYSGFNKTDLNEGDRFYSYQKDNGKYRPIKMLKSYSLDELPSLKTFLKDFEETEDDE